MTTSDYGKAYEAYQQAVYRDGKNPAFWCSIGVLYYNINQFHDALDAYSRAIRIHPYLSEVWFNLGALYESCNDQMTDAIDAYQRTLQLEPANTLVATRLREIREHQTSGTPLSAPPQPKDISPSSLSWNYATNAGGAPSHLSQGGLGLELSPALGRPANGATSPPNGHRFDGPPPAGRPHSTDPYRGDDRRRASGGGQLSPTVSLDHSPRSSHRTTGPSQPLLPQIKGLQDARGSPPGPLGSDINRRNSPLSPRTRHSDAFEPGYPPQNGYHGGPPPNFPSSFPRGGPSEGADRGSEMDWERPRNGSIPLGNGRAPAQSHRRSPPGSSHSRGEFQPPVPPSAIYDRRVGSPGTSRPPPVDDRDRNGRVSPYPPPLGYGYPPGYDARRFDPRGERPERAERERDVRDVFGDDERRRGAAMSGSRAESPRPSPSFVAPFDSSNPPAASTSVGTPAWSAGPSTSALTNGKGKGGRGRKDDSVGSPSASGRKDSLPKSRKAKDPDAAGGAKKERRVSTPKVKEDSSGGRKRGGSTGTPKPQADVPSTPASPSEPSPVATEGPTASTSLPSREVDEDYDEGVDALMGLASSGSTSSHGGDGSPPSVVLDPSTLPPLPSTLPPLPPLPVEERARTATPDTTELTPTTNSPSGADPDESVVTSPNERKRSLGSPERVGDSKRRLVEVETPPAPAESSSAENSKSTTPEAVVDEVKPVLRAEAEAGEVDEVDEVGSEIAEGAGEMKVEVEDA